MSLYALLRNAYDPETGQYVLTEEAVEMEGALDGNLCRCTGYVPILEAAKSFVREDLKGVVVEGGAVGRRSMDARSSSSRDSSTSDATSTPAGDSDTSLSETENGTSPKPCGREDCCRLSTGDKVDTGVEALLSGKTREYSFPQFNFRSYEPHTEVIYPPSLRKHVKRPICFGNARKVWFRPVTLEQLLEIKGVFPSAKIVAGSSEVQVEVKFKNEQYAVSVYVGDIEELKGFEIDETGGKVTIGGNTPLILVEKQCSEGYKRLGQRGLVLEAIRKQLRYFAGRQAGQPALD